MHVEDFLANLRASLAGWGPLTDYCTAQLGSAPSIFVGTWPRQPADVDTRPIIVIEDGPYELAQSAPGKLISPFISAAFRKEGHSDNMLSGIAVRQGIFRHCLEAMQAMDEVEVVDVTAEPEYLTEYPHFAIYSQVTFLLPPSDSLTDLEGAAFDEL